MNATGKQVHEAIQTLPPDQQAMLLSKQLDVEMAEIHSFTAIQESLAKADIAGSSTRPEIAKMMATVVCFAVVAFVSAWVVALFTKQAAMEQVSGSWPVMLTALGTPTALLRSYFGLRTKEKNGRYGIALGQAPQPSPLASLAGALFGGKQ